MKNIAPLTRKREALQKKAAILLADIKEVDAQIQAYKDMLIPITGGLDPEVIIACEGRVEVPELPEIPEEEEVAMEEGYAEVEPEEVQ